MRLHASGPLLVAPALLTFTIVTLLPAAWVIRMSLYDSSYIAERWVGLGNYRETLADPAWWRALWVTARFAVLVVPAEVLLPLAVALYLATERKGLRTFVQGAFHLPGVISSVVMVGVWKWIFARRGGLVNGILGAVGIGPLDWWAGTATATAAMCLMLVFIGMGGSLILYVALLQGVDRDVMAAAQIDGASAGQIRWRVLAPVLYPTAGLFGLLALIAAAQIWFLPYILTSGGPAHSTETAMFNIYLEGFWLSRYGMANARSVLLTLVIVGLALAHRRMAR